MRRPSPSTSRPSASSQTGPKFATAWNGPEPANRPRTLRSDIACRVRLVRIHVFDLPRFAEKKWIPRKGNAMDGQPQDSDDSGRLSADDELGRLQWTTLEYYLKESNPVNGLIRDKTDQTAPASIAAVGMALAAIPILVERGVVHRQLGAVVALKRLRFFHSSPHGPEPDATGYRGFYYHFLDMNSGRRVWECELSTIDSAFLLAGMLTVARNFDRDTGGEAEARSLPDQRN